MKNLIDVPVQPMCRNVNRSPDKIKPSMICILAILLYGVFETAKAGDTLSTDTTFTDVIASSQVINDVNIPLVPTIPLVPISETVINTQPLQTQELSIHYELESDVIYNIPSILTPPRISSGFGKRKHPIFGKIKNHNGIDLPFPIGTPILAPANGVIIFAGWKNGFGNVVQIDHGNGYTTLFAHNSINLVHVGDHVTITTTIAKVGSTGWATGPHIHFEVRFNGDLLNPLKFLKR